MTDIERLVEFLEARTAEDERAADDLHRLGCDATLPMPMNCDCAWPARVLADCAARRAIIETYVRWQASHPGDCKGAEGYVLESGSDFDLFGPCKQHEALSTVAARKHTLLLLAQPFRTHLDFDLAWLLDEPDRPDTPN